MIHSWSICHSEVYLDGVFVFMGGLDLEVFSNIKKQKTKKQQQKKLYCETLLVLFQACEYVVYALK